MRRRESALRNILLLGVLLLAAVALIAFLPLLRSPGPAMPPEPPEVTAKRFAPENAYRTLEQALKRTPMLVAGRTPAVEAAQTNPMDAPQRDPVDELLDTHLPGLVLRIDPQGPMLASVREALAQPYFLWPVDWSNPDSGLMPWQGGNWRHRRHPAGSNAVRDPFMEAIERFAQIGRMCAGRATAAARQDQDYIASLAYMLDALRLALRIQEDGDYLWPSLQLLRDLVPSVYDAARGASDGLLLDASAKLDGLRGNVGSALASVEFLMRRIDASRNHKALQRADDPEHFFEGVVSSIRVRRLRRWIADHREEIMRSVALPYSEFRIWQLSQRDAFGRRHDFSTVDLVSSIDALAQAKAETRMWLDGAKTIVALEQYHLKNGAYPENLDALVPDFLGSVPQDVFAGDKPLVYGRVNDNYRLYSVGQNGIDNGGMITFGKSVSGPGEDLVAHWPGNPGGAKQ
jgi:hypothetical protein